MEIVNENPKLSTPELSLLKIYDTEGKRTLVRQPSTFGKLSKSDSIKDAKKSASEKDGDLEEYADCVNWYKYDEMWQNRPRPKIASNVGKRSTSPGPEHYTPQDKFLSVNETSPKYSLQSRHPLEVNSFRSEAPGPGKYDADIELVRPKINNTIPWNKSDREQKMIHHNQNLGPGTYNYGKIPEKLKFPNQQNVILARREKSRRRQVVDKISLTIDSEAPDVLSHGPGYYYDGVKVGEKTARPTSPSFSFGFRRDGKHEEELPGPGSYNSDRGLFGEMPLQEHGGMVTRSKISTTGVPSPITSFDKLQNSNAATRRRQQTQINKHYQNHHVYRKSGRQAESHLRTSGCLAVNK